MPGCSGELGSLGLEPKRLRDVLDEVEGVDILGLVVKAVAEVAVSRRVAMLAVFMVVVYLFVSIGRRCCKAVKCLLL